MIWEAIQKSKSAKKDLHVIWLDLANAYGAVPHQMLWQALKMYHVPEEVIRIIQLYFSNFRMRFSTDQYTTDWMPLEIGIAMGCTISPILFVLAMQVILSAAETHAEKLELKEGCYMPPIKAFMDDTTILTTKEEDARKVLQRLQDLIKWCRMSFKPKKSRSLSLKAGKLDDSVTFTVAGQDIPTLAEEPVKSLGRLYNSSLKDTCASSNTQNMLVNGLQAIENSCLLGKFKLWCLQFMLIPKLLWPLLIYDIPISTVERFEAKINKHTRKWLGVPPGLTDVALYGKRTKLALPLKSLVEEYKAGKARLLTMLQDSKDEHVRSVEPTLKTGRKWKVAECVEAAKQSLQLKEVIGYTQTDRKGFGHGEEKLWSKAGPKQKRDMVIHEIRNEEEQKRFQKAVQQAQQGQWTTWEDALQRSLTWNDIWHMAPLRISFIIRAVYDQLPTNTNLVKWNKADDAKCSLCGQVQTLDHVLSSCNVALSQGRYTWRHNRVLRDLSDIVHTAKEKANSRTDSPQPERPRTRSAATKPPINFIKAGGKNETQSKSQEAKSILHRANDWEMSVDLPGLHNYPACIKQSGQRPDMVLFSKTANQIILIELTVPYETRIGERHAFKEAKYEDLAQNLRKNGTYVQLYAVEVGARGLLGSSVYSLLVSLGINGQRRSRALKRLAESAEKASQWIWQERHH